MDDTQSAIPSTDNPQPQIVFLSLSDGQTRARVLHATGTALEPTVNRLIARASQHLDKTEKSPRWIKIDFVHGISAPTRFSTSEELTLPAYLWGISFPSTSNMAFLPGEVLGNQFIDHQNHLDTDSILQYLKSTEKADTETAQKIFEDPDSSVHRFQTTSYFSSGNDVRRLQFDKRPVDEITRDGLSRSLQTAGDYLTRSVEPSGRFDYLYDPTNDQVEDDYNMVRHAGTTFSMFQLERISSDQELSHAAQRASKFMQDKMEPTPLPEQEGFYIRHAGKTKLGTNALAILALVEQAKATNTSSPLKSAAKLAQWIASVQNESGKFEIHRQIHPSGKKSPARCQYYPGEVIFAMTQLYREDNNALWLEVAEKSAQYLINERDKGKSDHALPHDHWLLYGLNELYRLSPQEEYLEHARRIATTIVESQNLEPRNPAWYGSYYNPPRSAPTATRTEGLCAAYYLENDHGDSDRARKYFRAGRRGMQFQLRTQIGKSTAMYFAKPQRALGGFTFSLNDPRIRIDVVQHNISAMLALRDILSQRQNSDAADK